GPQALARGYRRRARSLRTSTAPRSGRVHSYSDGGFDRRVRIVVLHDDVVVGVVEDRIPLGQKEFRVWPGFAAELGPHLVDVIVVDVPIAAGPDELADAQAGLGRHPVM